MAQREIHKSEGHHLSGGEVTVDTEINFVNNTNPEADTTGGSFIWKMITGITTAWKLRDSTKGQDIITIDTDTDTVTANNTDYTFIGFSSISASVIFTIQAVAYAAVAGDWVDMTTGATNKTITFPASPALNDIIKVSKVDAGAGDVDIDGNGANINGSGTDVLATQYLTYTYQYNGTEWRKH